jgi:hypothetical protein
MFCASIPTRWRIEMVDVQVNRAGHIGSSRELLVLTRTVGRAYATSIRPRGLFITAALFICSIVPSYAQSSSMKTTSLLTRFQAELTMQYRRCWSYVAATDTDFTPMIHVQFAPTGALIGMPVLLNHPSNPTDRNLADSALRAVRMCNPLRIPDEYKPYYETWKNDVVRFDPKNMAN